MITSTIMQTSLSNRTAAGPPQVPPRKTVILREFPSLSRQIRLSRRLLVIIQPNTIIQRYRMMKKSRMLIRRTVSRTWHQIRITIRANRVKRMLSPKQQSLLHLWWSLLYDHKSVVNPDIFQMATDVVDEHVGRGCPYCREYNRNKESSDRSNLFSIIDRI